MSHARLILPVALAVTGNLPDLHELEPGSSTWTDLSGAVSGTAPGPRNGMVMEAVGDRVYVFGGIGDRRMFNDLFAFEPANRTWSALTSFASGGLPSARGFAGGAALEGRLYVFGGSMDGVSYFGEHERGRGGGREGE
eukprot:2813101-Rhodomonas_salina.3